MPIPQKTIKFLEKNKVKYELVKHRIVYTAFDKAQTLKSPEKMVGKTLVVKFDKNVAVVLIPANKNLDKNKFKKITKTKKVDFVSERIIKNKLKGVKVGAIPPFGLQPTHHPTRKLPTFIDKSLINHPKIIVNGGDYNWSIKISPAVFKKLIPNLVIGNFSKSRR